MTRNVPWVLKGVEQKQMFHNIYINMTPTCSNIWKLNSVEFWGRLLKTWHLHDISLHNTASSSISITLTDDLDRPGVLSCTVPIWYSLRSGKHDLSIPSCVIKKQIWTNPGVRGALTGTSKWGPVEGPRRGQTRGGGLSWSKRELCWRCLWERCLNRPRPMRTTTMWTQGRTHALVYELDSANHPGLSFLCQNGKAHAESATVHVSVTCLWHVLVSSCTHEYYLTRY